MQQVRVDTVWDSGFPGTSPTYVSALKSARDVGIAWRRPNPGDTIALDGVHVTILGPDSGWVRGQENPNEASLIVMVQFGAQRFLFTGDAEHLAEARLVERYGSGLGATVLKAGHHGSRTSSTPDLLIAVDPAIVLMSVGAGNDYGHPSATVLQMLHERGIHVLRTDDEGTIVLSTDGATIDVTTQDTTWHYSARPSAP
jgi:competence protein ComEC